MLFYVNVKFHIYVCLGVKDVDDLVGCELREERGRRVRVIFAVHRTSTSYRPLRQAVLWVSFVRRLRVEKEPARGPIALSQLVEAGH